MTTTASARLSANSTDLWEGRQPGLQMGGDAGAAEHAGEHADEGDADLHGGQEALRDRPTRRGRPRRP